MQPRPHSPSIISRSRFTAAAEQESALGGLARAVTNAVAVVAPIALLILSALALVGDSYNPFLYFRF